MKFSTAIVAGLVFGVSTVVATPPIKFPQPRYRSKAAKAGYIATEKSEVNGTESCPPVSAPVKVAPLPNVFAGLTNTEAADVTAFLHKQSSLNLTAFANATEWDNVIVIVEVLPPNKTDALPFLNGAGAMPLRYAKATIQFQATLEPYIQEYMIGPLPVSANTTLSELNYPYNKGQGRSRVYNADASAYALFLGNVSASVSDITLDLWNATYLNLPNDTISLGASDPLEIDDDGSVTTWNEFGGSPSNMFADGSLLQTGLAVRTNLTGRDPAKWSVLGWYYNGKFYKTTQEFRTAYYSPGFEKLPRNIDGDFGWTDRQGKVMPLDNVAPPQLIAPQGNRFVVDEEQKYVEWMDFSFYVAFRRDTGMRLYDIKFKGERIIYELGMEEALAHYAGSGPSQSSTAFLDSYYGFGPYAFELVGGYDCPSYATYLNSSFYWREQSTTHPNSICLFEMDSGFPISRHSGGSYVNVNKNIFFTMRSISTLGNYDYMFEYSFYMDGSIHVTVRASGYIDAAFWAHNSDYGFKIHDYLSGSMHDHVLNYRLDMDINGTANSLMKIDVVPTSEVYPWSAGQVRNTMKLNKTFIESEDDGKLMWGPNGATMYAVVNKDTPNIYGEYPGYRIAPGTASTPHLTVINSTDIKQSANWADHQLFATKHHDTEPRSAYAYNFLDPGNPAVNFNKFFNGESLNQTDLVLYFNLGMHHVPDTQDLPHTVFTSAHSSVILTPQNYNLVNPSRANINQVRVNSAGGVVSEIAKFGSVAPMCMFNLSSTVTNLTNYLGDVVIRKWPYDPSDPFYMVANGADTVSY